MARGTDGLFKRGRIWWAWVRGQRVSCRTSDRKAAQIYKAKLERLAADPAHLAAHETTVGVALKEFLVHFKTRDRSPHTLKMHGRTGGHLARILGTDTPLAEVTAAAVDRFIATRLGEDCARVTLGKELTTLRGALKLAKRHGKFPFDLDAIMPNEFALNATARERALENAWQIVVLVATVEKFSPKHARMIAFIVATGARKSEAESAHQADVDWTRGVVKIRGTKTKGAADEVPILPVFEDMLRYSEPCDFDEWQNMTRDLEAACVRAGIEKVTANDLRRTTATLLRKAGASTDMIARMLRHADSRMVERVYGRIRAEAARDVITAQLQHTAAALAGNQGVRGLNRTGDTRIFNSKSAPSSGAETAETPTNPSSAASDDSSIEHPLAHRNSTAADRYFRALSWGWFRRAA
jgi:integrase